MEAAADLCVGPTSLDANDDAEQDLQRILTCSLYLFCILGNDELVSMQVPARPTEPKRAERARWRRSAAATRETLLAFASLQF